MLTVLVNGALGKMGRETLKAISNAPNLQLVGAVDINAQGHQVKQITGLETALTVTANLKDTLEQVQPDVVVDFTRPDVVMENLRLILSYAIAAVVGTTGFTEENRIELDTLSKLKSTAVLIAPNFSIGAILMMKYSAEIIKYMPKAEIIELHHDQKLDAPSGTAMLTAKMMAEARGGYLQQGAVGEKELLVGARGGDYEGIRVHSVRLQGYVAHQEVIFGGLGETLTIRHDSISRESFMPGVVLACGKIKEHVGLIYGLDKML